ncbi:MAG: SDR family oxidoreductase [Selenomonadaceae bacterium]|nr:SDR family oxidoreductase [Selenomonadaceae bacterium]
MNINFDFTGKNFVIVGASSGIGKQTAIELARSGANVLAIGRNIERLEQLKNICPTQIFTMSLDVIDAEQDDWAKLFSNFVSAVGKIDGGVYSAGIVGLTPLNSFDRELAHRIFDTSFWGMINFMQSAAKKKFSNVGSSFVLLSSLAADFGTKSLFAYSAAKAAVKAAVKPIAKEIIRNRHRINTVSPAMVKTDMLGNITYEDEIGASEISRYLLGLGKPEDISGLILFLLSDRAGWITGQDFPLDGGYLLD